MGILSRFASHDRSYDAAVKHDAVELRRRYGGEAERWCEAGMASASSPGTRRMLREIHRALADVPPEA